MNRQTIIEIFNFAYLVKFQLIKDAWLPSGNVFNHPKFDNGTFIYTSPIKEFEEDSLTFVTVNGSCYEIKSFRDNNSELQIKYIKEALAELKTYETTN